MTNLMQRVLTAILLAMVIILSIVWSPYSYLLLIIAINVLGLLEFYRLFAPYTLLPRNIFAIILSVTILITFTLVIYGYSTWRILFTSIFIAFGIFITELYMKSMHPFQNLGIIFLGIICITVPLCFFIALSLLPLHTPNYPYIVLGYFFILWSNDSGAYFTGKYLGKRPLFLRLSPKKTWEGSLGGALCALVATFILSESFSTFSWSEWSIIALIIIVTGTIGDLIKSLMKRSLNVKDSGNILPGHGGILDRFDTLLGSAPFVYCYLSLFGHI